MQSSHFSAQQISFEEPSIRMGSVSGIMTLASLGRMASEQKFAEERKPRRALTSYNLFFQSERQRLLAEQKASNNGKKSKLGFAGLARHIAAKWKKLSQSEKQPFEDMAAQDKQRYISEKAFWEESQKNGSMVDPAMEQAVEPAFNPSLMSMLSQTPQSCDEMTVSPYSASPLVNGLHESAIDISGTLELINDFLLEEQEDDLTPLDLNPITLSSPMENTSVDISPNEVFTLTTHTNARPLSWYYLMEQMGEDCVDDLIQCFRR